ncbi:hypothetical protein BRAS3843_1060040 [Bradyrhizobium sp. STM 3843]|uniref:hypothetical protein n=1 Tax=Bradyrhizobium sp. STM 3843 TaxID=551947 RepID=UPI000240A428|nr:hypothetical protein [Bradyrhizobium sp. STM 3843]CCE04373.1 hypothetical protein BRAS3843_1060040 [Bradyrhizobium sp. STM 3843]
MNSDHWTKGYTQIELDDAQAKFGLVFPPDLVALLRDRRPVRGHDWSDPTKSSALMSELRSPDKRSDIRGSPAFVPDLAFTHPGYWRPLTALSFSNPRALSPGRSQMSKA